MAYKQASSVGRLSVKELRKAVKPVAEAYGAASVTMEIPSGKGERHLHYIFGDKHDADQSGQIVSFEGEAIAGGKTVITWVCRSDRVWTDDEIDDISFLCKTSCTLSERMRLNAIANSYFYLDMHTGISNINGLGRFVTQLIRRGVFDEYGFAILNVISFNYVNKKAGFRTGSRLMKQYALAIRDMLSKDEHVARLGGDNFVIVFKKENLDRILSLAEGMVVKTRVNSATIRFELASRLGIYMVAESDEPFDKILSYLSSSINYAKYYARTNVVFFDKAIEKKVLEHKEFCQRFKNGIEKEEFFVVYQPKVFTKDNTLYGAEALVRWNCDGRVIYPGEFVEIFEKEHLISELDFYVLEHACMDLRKWLDSGLNPVRISVNFSNDHLGSEELVERITETVDRYGIDHKFIEIEMTETVDVNEIEQLLSFVNDLHKNGFTVAMDDFGIGYSSLLMLQNISVDVLKIDRAFVAEVTGDSGKRENIILRHIIDMAEELGVEIVAEGVETFDQRENLSNMNCHRIQGYFFDRPLSSEDFSNRLAAKNY